MAEKEECLEIMSGAGPADLRELCLELAAWMFYLGERAPTVEEGKRLAAELIASGAALKKFHEIARLQGGDPLRLPRARNTLEIPSPARGFVHSIQCEQVGTACVVLGGGREKKEDSVDPAVGIVLQKKVGDAVRADAPLCTVYYNSDARLAEARRLLESSYRITEYRPTAERPLIHQVIEGGRE